MGLEVEEQLELNDIYLRQSMRFIEGWASTQDKKEAFDDIEKLFDLLRKFKATWNSKVEASREDGALNIKSHADEGH